MPTIDVGEIELYYELLGSGPRLLFFNGSQSTIESSRLLIEQYAKHFEVAVHDQRGLGRTTIPEVPSPMAAYAADGAALLDHLGWATSLVVGTSFGGMVAQEYAVTWPERVERLALVCTSSGGAGGSSYPLHELQDPADAIQLLDSRFTDSWLAEHPTDRGIVEMLAQRQSEPKDERTLAGERGQLESRRGHDVYDRLPRITCPTLVAAGRYDGIAPLPNSEAIARQIPNSELRVFEGGHAFFVQDPAAFPAIIEFLSIR